MSIQIEIIYLTNIFACELIYLGYSKQHIYNVCKDFFSKNITNASCIDTLFSIFSFENTTWDIITFVNSEMASCYNDSMREIITFDDIIEIQNFSNEDLEILITTHRDLTWLKRTWDNLLSLNNKVSLIRAKVSAYDPYSAYKKLRSFIEIICSFLTMLDNTKKQDYYRIACINYQYNKSIVIKRPTEKRIRVLNEDYAQKSANVLSKLKMSRKMFNSFLNVLKAHNFAIAQDTDSEHTLLMLWIALETLFITDGQTLHKSKIVEEGIIEIIQRTYIIKTLKHIHRDLIGNIKKKQLALIEQYDLENIDNFITLLFDDDSSPRKIAVLGTLEDNPLLRIRISTLVTQNLSTANSIKLWLDKHKQKIEWQIKRIYRARNIIVHTGKTLPYVYNLVECMHDYIDFVINYLICKIDNDEVIRCIDDVITEMQLDNELHRKILSENRQANVKANINKYLFGASNRIVDYYRKTMV